MAYQRQYFSPCMPEFGGYGTIWDLVRTHSGLPTIRLGLILNRLNANTFKLNESAVRNWENPRIWAYRDPNLKFPSIFYWKYILCNFHSKSFKIYLFQCSFSRSLNLIPLITLSSVHSNVTLSVSPSLKKQQHPYPLPQHSLYILL